MCALCSVMPLWAMIDGLTRQKTTPKTWLTNAALIIYFAFATDLIIKKSSFSFYHRAKNHPRVHHDRALFVLNFCSYELQGVSPLSVFYKSWNTQICVILQENNLIQHYHRKIYFHFRVSLDTFSHTLCTKKCNF